ncbi:MAG: hypothetical protein DRN40_07170 [Thermoplasmata archaeon]|mgnify:CR=1 FL=1|nr:MAG: hypothetical protein DRN40_07170 [Thermoplasmata archaeon]
MNVEGVISGGESESLELKRSLSEWRGIIETVSAFSNTKGGIIVVGVDDNKNLVGVDIGKGTIEDITNKILNNTEPKIYPEIKIAEGDGKRLIIIKVEEYPFDVVLAFGRPFKRVGRNTVRISKDEYKRRILEIHKKEIYFDGQPLTEARINEIDEEKLREFVKKAREVRKLDVEEKESVRNILKKLKLLKGNALTNAAILLFGREPERIFNQIGIKCVRFKGMDVSNEMLDFKEIEGTLFTEVEEVEKFIFSNISLRAWIEDGKIRREERWEYPPKAIREALVNAIVHRDYCTPSKVQIRIFDDRVEFWNPGRLPEGWTVETLKEEHTSEPFNPLVARMFFWIGYIEEIGTGTNKMIKWCKEWGLPEPDFQVRSGSIVITFRKSKLTDEYLEKLGLNEHEKEIIQLIKEKKKITSYDVQRKYGVSRDTANRWLNRLIGLNLVERVGRGRTTYYILRER